MDAQKPKPQSALWWYGASLVIALIFFSAIGFVWYRVCTAPPLPYPGETIVATPVEIAQCMDAHVPVNPESEPPIYIPTGVFVQWLIQRSL